MDISSVHTVNFPRFYRRWEGWIAGRNRWEGWIAGRNYGKYHWDGKLLSRKFFKVKPL